MNDRARKARIFLGFAVLLLVLLAETLVADRKIPNPASPYVWGVLALGAAVCLGLAAWFHVRSRLS